MADMHNNWELKIFKRLCLANSAENIFFIYIYLTVVCDSRSIDYLLTCILTENKIWEFYKYILKNVYWDQKLFIHSSVIWLVENKKN